ncbi:hypothetical protein G7Z17_g9332 [Cylindrodendrum hubeiense]|uniref:Methyltransferase type 11 domain-containing protein n=1 Tax=Cylindrodendrum hubeiense TaxID=595255 RepID=A0A9P5GZQ0_9HYPO|nr:hypothetical protein G7Z17_g9332 [Cylindrodendrum hubeiense]
MSHTIPAPTLPLTEKTFSSYNKEQGSAYFKVRPDYHPTLYQFVVDQHTSTGGQFDTLVDVGCGPGLAARALGPRFASVIGLDPSEGMIETARSLGGVTSTSDPIRFERSSAEELGGVKDSSVDLITAANAAHWFDMEGFWPAAARVLKPGGTVALWTSGDIHAHPSMPNSAAIQATFETYQATHLEPYYVPGNRLTRATYRTLPLPWTLSQPVEEFEESSFVRKDWEADEPFFVGESQLSMDIFELAISSGSAQVRWHQAHPDLVGTERDLVKILRGEVERLLHEAGVEKGKEFVRGAVLGAVLIFKKKL